MFDKYDKVYGVLDVCDYIIRKYNEQNRLVNPSRLHCLIFFCKAYFIAKQNRSLFSEKMYAEDFGAIVPEVHTAFRSCGANSILVLDGVYLTHWGFRRHEIPAQLKKEDAEMIDKVIKMTDGYSFTELHDAILLSRVWRKRKRYWTFHSREITDDDFREAFTDKNIF